MKRKWLVIEDWTKGKYPEHHGGIGHVFARCWTEGGARGLASMLNRDFGRATIVDGRGRPNVEFLVKREG
jgi:hypothetical protein